MHIEQVLGDVPKSDRCRCNEKADGPAESAASVAAGGSWWSKLTR